ncbi:hypothetical protein CLV59_103416 [Chitinophaga dinghuensis]|uniref:Uncharacterized protein n=1 Tax=Chitinophaga dinghuensis TaxID=1539050 RepID=A0A327WBG7_9BACT|nr:hypothetical protein CLV59_103416 [Chitinophaga dinghuensis]
MKRILDIFAILLTVVIELIEIYSSKNTAVLTILYCVLLVYVFRHYNYIILEKDYYKVKGKESVVIAIVKIVCFYIGLGGVFLLWSSWSSYPLYLLVPRMLFWITVGLFPIIYFKNIWRRKCDNTLKI